MLRARQSPGDAGGHPLECQSAATHTRGRDSYGIRSGGVRERVHVGVAEVVRLIDIATRHAICQCAVGKRQFHFRPINEAGACYGAVQVRSLSWSRSSSNAVRSTNSDGMTPPLMRTMKQIDGPQLHYGLVVYAETRMHDGVRVSLKPSIVLVDVG